MISYNFMSIIYRKFILTDYYNKGKINIRNINDPHST